MTESRGTDEAGRERSLIVGMSGSTGLAIVRALGAAGVRPLVLHDDDATPGFATRLATCRRCPDWRTNADEFLDFLLAAGRELNEDGGKASLFVADDSALDVVWGARGPLRDVGLLPAFSFVHPPAEVLDKREQARAALGAGVDAPWTEHGDAGELAARAGDFTYPLLVKPAISHDGVKALGAKALSCADAGELRAALERTKGFAALVQDFVPGADDQLFTAGVFRGGGRALVFTGRKLKQHPPTLGISRLSEALEVPEIVAGSVRLCRELGYEGVAQVEYKRDARDGVYRLMEVNFRPWTWIGLATACGVPLITAAHQWALGQEHEATVAEGEEIALRQSGGRWIWIVPEAIHTLRGLSRGERPQLSQWRHLKAEAFYARRDPAPFRRAVAAPFDRRLTAAKRLATRVARPPAFAINALALPALARRERREPPVMGLPPGDRALVLAPHPDDESIMCGATLAASRRRGDTVRIVAVTSGAATNVREGSAAADVAGVREVELRRAAAELGVSDVVFLGISDRGVPEARARVAELLVEQLAELAPTDVYVPFPYDVHPDHVATSLALADALEALVRMVVIHGAGGNGGGARPALTVHCGFVQTPASPGWLTRVVPAGGDWPARRRALAAHASRNRAIFIKPQQLAWFNPGSTLRPSEAFVDLPAEAYLALCRKLAAEGFTRPSLRSPWHPLLTSYELERTRIERIHIAAILKDVSGD